MDRLVYTALSGMKSSMDRQRMLANNMANAQTIGFRAELADQRAVTLTGDGLEVRAMQQSLITGADMAAGEMVPTGRDLDIAVSGDTLIAVQAPNGDEAYTRRGDFSVNVNGMLLNGAGHPVMGINGPITLPPGGKPSIAPDGVVSVTDPANPNAPATEVGQIKLVSWTGSDIAKGLDNLLRVQGGGTLPQDAEAKVNTGVLEQSNVKTTQILVDMIDQQRLYAMRSKMVGTARELDEDSSRLMRLG